MKKTVLSNYFSVVALSCILGVTACAVGVDEEDAFGEENSSDEYGSVSQSLELVSDTLPTSGTKTVSIASYPGDEAVVIMSSPSSGNWEFKANGSPLGWDGCYTGDHAVFTYWKEGNGSWNYWPGGGGLCWPTSFWTTSLYSGSSSISYKFVIENYVGWPDTPYGQGVYLKFTKL